jgi:hypothetical protein
VNIAVVVVVCEFPGGSNNECIDHAEVTDNDFMISEEGNA